MQKMKEGIASLCFLLIIPVLGMIYPLLNNSSNGVRSLVTEVDRSIPFISQFVVPYILWYPFIFLCLVYFCFRDRKTYFRTLISLAIGMLLSYFIYFVFQTHVPRPAIEGNDIFSKLVSAIYMQDSPFNCFPSLHVFESYLMIRGAYAISENNKIVSLSISVIGVLIILSTLFIKQHVLLDVLGGIYLGEIIFNKVPYIDRAINYSIRKDKRSFTSN